MATSESSQAQISAHNPRRGPDALPTRRGVVGSLLAGWGLFLMASSAGLLACVRYLFPNVLYEPPASFKAGPKSAYGLGVDETFKNSHGTWLVRTESDPLSDREGIEGIYALSTVCTHLGCIPNWQAGDQKFKCPCHGSGFRPSGLHFEGPAPRPLERWRIVEQDGQVLVDKSLKFQWEKGQWVNPEAFLPI